MNFHKEYPSSRNRSSRGQGNRFNTIEIQSRGDRGLQNNPSNQFETSGLRFRDPNFTRFSASVRPSSNYANLDSEDAERSVSLRDNKLCVTVQCPTSQSSENYPLPAPVSFNRSRNHPQQISSTAPPRRPPHSQDTSRGNLRQRTLGSAYPNSQPDSLPHKSSFRKSASNSYFPANSTSATPRPRIHFNEVPDDFHRPIDVHGNADLSALKMVPPSWNSGPRQAQEHRGGRRLSGNLSSERSLYRAPNHNNFREMGDSGMKFSLRGNINARIQNRGYVSRTNRFQRGDRRSGAARGGTGFMRGKNLQSSSKVQLFDSALSQSMSERRPPLDADEIEQRHQLDESGLEIYESDQYALRTDLHETSSVDALEKRNSSDSETSFDSGSSESSDSSDDVGDTEENLKEEAQKLTNGHPSPVDESSISSAKPSSVAPIFGESASNSVIPVQSAADELSVGTNSTPENSEQQVSTVLDLELAKLTVSESHSHLFASTTSNCNQAPKSSAEIPIIDAEHAVKPTTPSIPIEDKSIDGSQLIKENFKESIQHDLASETDQISVAASPSYKEKSSESAALSNVENSSSKPTIFTHISTDSMTSTVSPRSEKVPVSNPATSNSQESKYSAITALLKTQTPRSGTSSPAPVGNSTISVADSSQGSPDSIVHTPMEGQKTQSNFSSQVLLADTSNWTSTPLSTEAETPIDSQYGTDSTLDSQLNSQDSHLTMAPEKSRQSRSDLTTHSEGSPLVPVVESSNLGSNTPSSKSETLVDSQPTTDSTQESKSIDPDLVPAKVPEKLQKSLSDSTSKSTEEVTEESTL